MGVIRDRIEDEDRKARRFGGMVERLHVDPAALGQDDHGVTLRRAVERCRSCRATCQCDAWLARESPEADPDFCPNLRSFTRFE